MAQQGPHSIPAEVNTISAGIFYAVLACYLGKIEVSSVLGWIATRRCWGGIRFAGGILSEGVAG